MSDIDPIRQVLAATPLTQPPFQVFRSQDRDPSRRSPEREEPDEAPSDETALEEAPEIFLDSESDADPHHIDIAV